MSESELEELNSFLKETKEYLKLMYTQIKKSKEIIDVKLTEHVLKIFNKIISNPDVLKELKKLKEFQFYSYNHALFVSIYSMMIGESLKYDDEELYSLGLGGLLIDSGMTRIDQEILNKKEKLTDEELLVIRNHPKFSYEVISKIPTATVMARDIVINHHERPDGKGYPSQKGKRDFSKYSALISFLDVFHALTTERPYHIAKPVQEAFMIIMSMRGKQFDSDILSDIIKHTRGA